MAQVRGLIDNPNLESALQNAKDYYLKFKKIGEEAVFTNDGRMHRDELTDPLIRQINTLEGVFEDASTIVVSGLMEYQEFASRYRSRFLEYWNYLGEDINHKRSSDAGLCQNYEALVKRLAAVGK